MPLSSGNVKLIELFWNILVFLNIRSSAETKDRVVSFNKKDIISSNRTIRKNCEFFKSAIKEERFIRNLQTLGFVSPVEKIKIFAQFANIYQRVSLKKFTFNYLHSLLYIVPSNDLRDLGIFLDWKHEDFVCVIWGLILNI